MLNTCVVTENTFIFFFYIFKWLLIPETVTQGCSYKKALWKYAANLQENNAEVRFQ